ncbi:hypothetical protein GGR54DRAFT_628853 [Hypoxylon sp. NC1633]|nr:hypothetical protein GGR54DRAFT_628853 [Hypoxylon sp. NC1633]
MEANDRILVIGIDFGTTFSGIGWAQSERAEAQALVGTWPRNVGGGTIGSPKVPTQLRYLPESPKSPKFQWGFQVDPLEHQNTLKLFKLGLEPDKYRRSATAIGKSLDFENVDQIITDYLTGLWKYFTELLKKQLGSGIWDNSRVHFVLTVPAIWSETARQRTIEAFERVPISQEHSTTLLSEPEAAAMSALHQLDRHGLKVNDSFVVVDAGGGTVDLITYTITALHPLLEVVEATEGSGDFCGSSRLNDRLVELLTSRFEGQEGWDKDLLHEMIDHFERITKRAFSMDSLTQNESFQLPASGLAVNKSLGVIRRGKLTLTAEELHMIYEPDIVRIIQLVKEQITTAQVPIRAVLLVGGYGASTYLRERLEIAVRGIPSNGTGIEVLQPPNSWTAVIRGAIMKGLSLVMPVDYDVPVVKARTGRKHYGYELGVPFDLTKHASLHSKRYYDGFSGLYRVKVMHWIIKRGELVSEDTPFTKSFYHARPVAAGRIKEKSLQVNADQQSTEAPLSRNDNVHLLCRVTANLDHIPEHQLDRSLGADGQMYYEYEFEIEAIYRSASTEYTLIHKGKYL